MAYLILVALRAAQIKISEIQLNTFAYA